jgi:hypothetical protein
MRSRKVHSTNDLTATVAAIAVFFSTNPDPSGFQFTFLLFFPLRSLLAHRSKEAAIGD